MLTFDFRINRSFLEWSSHPITVPKSQIDYRALEGALGGAQEGQIRFPNGGVAPVCLYQGTAGYGEYYQLRIAGRGQSARHDLAYGQHVRVSLAREAGRLDVDVRAR